MKKILFILIIFCLPIWAMAQRANSNSINVNQNITDLLSNNYKVYYSDGSGNVIELSLGADGSILKSNGATSVPTFAIPQLSDNSDIGVTTPTNRYILIADGDSWESRALTEADISDLQSYITTESDPTFSSSQAANITSTDITNLSNLSGVNTGDQDISGIATNASAITVNTDSITALRVDINQNTNDISGKQETLVSGTNIKTINSTSLLGSGNIDISGINYDAFGAITYSSTPTMDFSASSNDSIVLTGDVDKLTITNLDEGGFGTIEVIQDGTGGWGIDTIYSAGLTTVYIPGVAPSAGNIVTTAGSHLAISYMASAAYLYIGFAKYDNSFTNSQIDSLAIAKVDSALSAQIDTFYYPVAISDETTDLTTGTAKITFRMPFACTLIGVRASVTTAPTGANLIVDINEGGVSVLSTKLSIDATETTSTTAATAAVISDGFLADDAEMTIDIDQIGSTVAGTGAKVMLITSK